MNKSNRNKTLITRIPTVLLLLLLASCSDPEANIKDLEGQELTNVIDTLYIDKDSDPDASTEFESNEESSISSIDSSLSTSSEINNNVIESKVISVPEQSNTEVKEIESSPLVSNDTLDNSLPSENEQDLPQNNVNNQNFTDTGFSEPVTESLTQAEKSLQEILAKYPIINIFETNIESNEQKTISSYCEKMSDRLSSVSMQGCLAANHRVSQFKTVEGNPIVVTEFPPKIEREPLGKILVIGGTHGDELTSVSTSYRWISNLNKFHSGLFHWRIAPAINADSVLKRPATRQNANGIDINRNLPTPDWDKQSEIRWEKLNLDPRKKPGTQAASEPETQWIMHEIESFQPDAIVSIHAPYGLLDFDSPKLKDAPKSFGRLQLNLLGTYPGSLGNYAGIQLGIPVLTLELPNATSMPSANELNAIWRDMIRWLRTQLEKE